MSHKNTLESIQHLFSQESAELDLTSEYKNNKSSTLKYTCVYGHKHTTSLANWRRGSRCKCHRQYKRKLTFYREAEQLLKKYNATLITTLEEYKDVITPLVFLNCVNEQQKISLNNLKVCDKFNKRKKDILAFAECDKKQIEIAEKFGTTQHIISMCFRLWGVNNSDGNRFIVIDIPEEILYSMYWKEEQHPRVIADKYNCSITTVVKNMQKYNIPFRTKSEARIGELNPLYNVGHTEKTRKKMSAAFVNGRTIGFHTNWGKTSIYETPSQGKVTMRSGWEVKTADYLTRLGYIWLYEPKAFKLSKTTSYTPDFYIPSDDVYIEVKGRLCEKSLEKINLFRNKGYNLLLWNGEELLKRGIITNAGDASINRKYSNNKPYLGLY